MGIIHDFKSLTTLLQGELATNPQISAIQTPTLFIKAAFKQFSHPTGKKKSSSVPKFTCKAGWYIHTQLN